MPLFALNAPPLERDAPMTRLPVLLVLSTVPCVPGRVGGS